mgnify:CR=1 FL=1
MLLLVFQVFATDILKSDSIYLVTPFYCDSEEVYKNTLESVIINSFSDIMKLDPVRLSGDTTFLTFYRNSKNFSGDSFSGYLDKGIRYALIVSYRNRFIDDDNKEVRVSLKGLINRCDSTSTGELVLPVIAGKKFIMRTIVSCNLFDLASAEKIGVFQSQVENRKVKIEKITPVVYANFRKAASELKREFRRRCNWTKR